MEIDDSIRLVTPEGVVLRMQLAGVGSRFAAALIDQAIQFGSIFAIFAVVAALGSELGYALSSVLALVLYLGYDIAFETLARGRTPGKRAVGLRVVLVGGDPVTFTAAAIRTLLRVIDIIPGAYLVGIVSILVSPKNQRLGDLAARTIVVRERRPEASTGAAAPRLRAEAVALWDITGVTPDDLRLATSFLARRADLPAASRTQLAAQVASRLRGRGIGLDADLADEWVIEQVVALRAERG